MANSTGWEILCPFDLTIDWNGGPAKKDIKLSSETHPEHVSSFAASHFQRGIVTFHTGYLFRTSPGIATWCMGPPNQPKDGIAPLSGLVETDWLPFPFTMNWQMTRPGRVEFKKDECFCFITLSEHMRMEEVKPTLKRLDDNPELKEDYKMWSTSRSDFIDKLQRRDADTVRQGWQKDYMRGTKADGQATHLTHLTKRKLTAPTFAPTKPTEEG